MAGDLPNVASGPSIFDFIRARLDPAGRLTEPGLPLPDEAEVRSGGLTWAAGAMDGAFGHHGGGGGSTGQARATAEAFTKACKRPSARNLRRLYELVRAGHVLDFIDPMIEVLVAQRPDREALHQLGRWLATTASDRGAVKVGIAILGVTGLGDDVAVVRVLGAHEEFTLYATVALTNGLEDPASELWALASSVDGWGRIHCVERLAGTDDPAIRSWILREGFRNSIMYEYLAYIAATTGGLLGALQADAPDRDLLTAAGEILEALVMGGPAEDLDDYESGADAVEAYLAHMSTRAETLGDFNAIATIRSFLDQEDGWDDRSARGWTATRRAAFEHLCHEIMQRPVWRDRIGAALLSADSKDFWLAQQAAQILGIDTFDVHVSRIENDPFSRDWYHAWKQADDRRAEQLVGLAHDLLPLSEIASGAAEQTGLGPEWRPHSALDWTLQALRDHVGVGGDLVLIGLRSPVIRNRNMALNVLKAWPESAWPAGARPLAEQLAAGDPYEPTREVAAEVLAELGT